MRGSEEEKSRGQGEIFFFFHLSSSVVHTSFQTQTYTPVMECKYLNMGRVGCFFLPSKMCCLGENDPKKTTRESLYFDFSKVTRQRAALPIFQSPLRVTEKQQCAARNVWIYTRRYIFPWTCGVYFTFPVLKSFLNQSSASWGYMLYEAQ